MDVIVKHDDATLPEVVELIESHLNAMQAQTPPVSVHALNLSAYQSPALNLWTAWVDDRLAGCGALQDHGIQQGERLGEIKSMHTKEPFVRMGVANAVLSTLLKFATEAGMQRVSLETGVTEHFKAANLFYQKRGFLRTTPFFNYTNDPHSAYYTIELTI